MRPTTQKVILALFHILGSVRGKKILELFAGSGRISWKALDEGADLVCLVEKCGHEASRLKKDFRNKANAKVLHMDARRALVFLKKKEFRFDIIFADPPYEKGWTAWLTGPGSFVLAELMEKEGIFILEHSLRETPSTENIRNLEFVETRRYGETCLSFFRKTGWKGEGK
jgi:16S rRNA (guanine(966)-N(2))-methyltransferase RsmD